MAKLNQVGEIPQIGKSYQCSWCGHAYVVRPTDQPPAKCTDCGCTFGVVNLVYESPGASLCSCCEGRHLIAEGSSIPLVCETCGLKFGGPIQ